MSTSHQSPGASSSQSITEYSAVAVKVVELWYSPWMVPSSVAVWELERWEYHSNAYSVPASRSERFQTMSFVPLMRSYCELLSLWT